MIAWIRTVAVAAFIVAVHSACQYTCPPVDNAVAVLAYSGAAGPAIYCEYGGKYCYYDTRTGAAPVDSSAVNDATCPTHAVCNQCTPLTACSASKNCGTQSDGCGGVIECGTCSLPEICGGSGVANVCGNDKCAQNPCTRPSACDKEGVGKCSVDGNGNTKCEYEHRTNYSPCTDINGIGYCRDGLCVNPCANTNCSAPPLCRTSKCESVETVPICTYPIVADGTACGNGGTCHYGYCLGQMIVKKYSGSISATVDLIPANNRDWTRFRKIFAPAISATAAAFAVLAVVYLSWLRRLRLNSKLAHMPLPAIATAI